MINVADKMEMESKLKGNLLRWMESHGVVLSDRQRSNEYVGVRIVEVRWREREYRFIQIDGMTCQIEKI